MAWHVWQKHTYKTVGGERIWTVAHLKSEKVKSECEQEQRGVKNEKGARRRESRRVCDGVTYLNKSSKAVREEVSTTAPTDHTIQKTKTDSNMTFFWSVVCFESASRILSCWCDHTVRDVLKKGRKGENRVEKGGGFHYYYYCFEMNTCNRSQCLGAPK